MTRWIVATVVALVCDLLEQRRRAGAHRTRGQEGPREQRAQSVEQERVRAPHLQEKARAQHSPDRSARAIRPHRHEEGRVKLHAPEQLKQAGDALLEPTARVDVDAQGYCRLNHSIVCPSPTSSVVSARTLRSSRIRRTEGTRRGMSSYPWA